MHKEYDFSNAKRVKDIPHLVKLQSQVKDKIEGKTKITIIYSGINHVSPLKYRI